VRLKKTPERQKEANIILIIFFSSSRLPGKNKNKSLSIEKAGIKFVRRIAGQLQKNAGKTERIMPDSSRLPGKNKTKAFQLEWSDLNLYKNCRAAAKNAGKTGRSKHYSYYILFFFPPSRQNKKKPFSF
jgi:hypothetical protein